MVDALKFSDTDMGTVTLGQAAADVVYDLYPEAAGSSRLEDQFFVGQLIASSVLRIIRVERELREMSANFIEFYPQGGEV